jgi:hypothetical protein
VNMELPDSENPHVLLGVAPDVDARDLKRAYVRLIKHYRPEQHPEAFQRIQKASERARARGRDDETAPPENAQQKPTIERPRSATREQASEGHVHARSPSAADRAPEPARGLWQAHHESDASSQSHGALHAVAGVHSPAGSTEPDEALLALRCDDPSEARQRFDALHANGKLSWQTLRSRPDTHIALLLFDEHIQRELSAGRGLELLPWLSSPEFEREVLRVPGLETVVWRVLCFTCMQAPEASLAVLRAHPGSSSTSDPNLALLEETLPSAELYRVMREKGAIPPWLTRLFEYGALETLEGSAARQVNDALGRDTQGVLATLDTLQREAPDLLTRLLSTVDRWLPRDRREFHELSGPERAWLKANAEAVDKNIDRTVVGYAPVLVLLGIGGVAVWGFSTLGFWLGLLSTAIAFVALAVGLVMADGRGYKRKVRPLLVTRFAVRGVSPDRIVEYATAPKDKTLTLDRFQREMRADAPLYALAALCRVSEKLNAGNSHTLVPERVLVEHEKVKAEVVAVVPGAAADMKCKNHAERTALSMCSGCARPLCNACTLADPELPPFCSECVAPRHVALRRALAEQESNYRGTGSCILLFGSLLLLLCADAVEDGNRLFASNTGGAAALVYLIGFSLKFLWPIARHALLLFAVLIVWLVPVGTALAFMAAKFAFSARAKRVFTAEYREALATTPPMRPTALYRTFDVLAVLFACLSVWIMVR